MNTSSAFQMLYYSMSPGLRRVVHSALPQQARRTAFKLFRHKEYIQLQVRRAVEGKFSLKPFDVHKCIFVHIPKTGGTSVTRSLFGRPTGGHAAIWKYQLIFDQDEFETYFKFAFVRNPWDRVLSAYEDIRRRGERVKDKEWVRRNLAGCDDFGSFVKRWVNKKNIYGDPHVLFIPQYEFISLGGSDSLMDFVGRFESLERDFDFIKSRLGIDCELQKRNMGARKDYREFYTEETMQIVAEAYREDIEMFNYRFDP